MGNNPAMPETDTDIPGGIVAYVRVPGRGPAWPVHDPLALQQMLGQMLLGRHSGRNHLPAALQAAPPEGLPLLLVQSGTVIAAFRLTCCTGTALTLTTDAALGSHTLGQNLPMLAGMTVQVRRLTSPLKTATSPAVRRPPRPAPPEVPWGRTAQYEWTRSAMDAPPAV